MNADSRALPPTPLPNDDQLRRAREWFERLVSEGGSDLPNFIPASVEDDALTTRQRYAVGRAIATPDICLIEAEAATSQKLADAVARHACRRGERVLLVAPAAHIKSFAVDDSTNVKRMAEVSRLTAAYRDGRWLSPSFWGTLFQPSLRREYDQLMTESRRHAGGHSNDLSVLTPEALVGDPRSWDRLVLCDVGEVDPQVICGLMSRASHWVMIGAKASAKTIEDAWQALLDDTWVREGDRLCCRIRPLNKSQRSDLTSEPLSDAPDIELRIYQPNNAQPELAEVVFPSYMTLAKAKESLARDLDEWPIDLEIDAVHWREDGERLVAHTNCCDGHNQASVEMKPGVHELVATCADCSVIGCTCGIAFDRGAGWDRNKAEAWLKIHCTGRTRRTVRV